MRSIYIFIVTTCTLNILGCYTSINTSSRNPIPEPGFIARPQKVDSIVILPKTQYFYQYKFDSREDDWSMTPDWALANLYHAGIKVIEAWYIQTTIPSYHRNFTTGALYPPFFVVGLANDDSYIEKLYYRKLDTFDPVQVSKLYLRNLMHYMPR